MAKLTAVFNMRDRMTSKIRKLRDNLNNVEKVTKTTTKNIQKLNNAKAAPKISVNDQATPRMNVFKKSFNKINGLVATARVKINDQASPVIDNINNKLDSLKTTVLTLGAGSGVTGGAIISSGMNAEGIDSQVGATTNLTKQQVTQIVDTIFYDQKIGNSRADVATSTQNLAQQTSLQGADLTGAVSASNMIAQLYNKDIAEVDRAIASTIKNLEMSGKQAGDTFAYIFKNAGDQGDDLLDTFWEYSSTFKKLKLDGGQVASALIAGISGGARNFDEMADSMREFGIRMYELSEGQIAAFQKTLGKTEANKLFEGLKTGDISGQEALIQVAQGLAKVKNETLRQQLATELLGTKFEDIGQPVLDMAAALNEPIKATGELDKQLQEMKDNDPFTPLKSAGRELGSMMKTTGSSIIQGVGPAFEQLNTWMSSKEGQQNIASMSQSISQLAVAFGTNLASAIQWTIQNWDMLAPILKSTGTGLLVLFSIVKIIIPLFTALVAAGKFLLPIFKFLWKGVMLLGKGFVTLLKFLIPIFKFLGKGIMLLGKGFVTLLTWIKPVVPWFLNLMKVGIRFIPVIGLLVSVITAVWWAFKNWDKISEVASNVFNYLMTNIPMWGEQIKQWAIQKALELVNGIVTKYEELKTKTGEKFESMRATIKEKMDAAKTAVSNFFSPLIDFIDSAKTKWDNFKTALSNFKMPSIRIPSVGGLISSTIGRVVDGSHANGISNIPFDGYTAELHKGETVLPKEEAETIRQMAKGKNRSSSSSKTVVQAQQLFGDIYVQNEADEDRLIKKIDKYLKEQYETGGEGLYE